MENILWVQHTAEARKKQLAAGGGLITTFRKGTKWLRPELIGQTVGLVNCNVAHQPPCTNACELFGTATVVSVKSCKFGDIDFIDHQRQSGDMNTGRYASGIGCDADANCQHCGTRSKPNVITDQVRLDIMRSVYGEYDINTLTTVITLLVNQ